MKNLFLNFIIVDKVIYESENILVMCDEYTELVRNVLTIHQKAELIAKVQLK